MSLNKPKTLREHLEDGTLGPLRTRAQVEREEELLARVDELEMVLRTWKNMMANPNYDLGEMASEFNAIVHQVLP